MPSSTASFVKHLAEDVETVLSGFEDLWKEYEGGDFERAVHEQRVAVNKLVGFASFLGLTGRKASQWPEGLRAMRAWQKRLGELRDVDVKVAWLEKIESVSRKKAKPAASAMQHFLQEKRARLRGEIAAAAGDTPGEEARAAVVHVREEIDHKLRTLRKKPRKFSARKSLLAVAEPWLEELEDLRFYQSHDALHEFRLRNKRLRFVLEMLSGCAEEEEWIGTVRERIPFVKQVHTVLGNVSDLVVFGDRLRTCRAIWMEQGLALDPSATALEEGRAILEMEEQQSWFAAWPIIAAPEFLGVLIEE